MGRVFADNPDGLDALVAQNDASTPPSKGTELQRTTGSTSQEFSKKTRWGYFSSTQEVTAVMAEEGVNRMHAHERYIHVGKRRLGYLQVI